MLLEVLFLTIKKTPSESGGQRESVVVVFRETTRNFTTFVYNEIQRIEESVLKEKLFGGACEGACAGAGMNDGGVTGIRCFAVSQFERTEFRSRNRLLGFGIYVRIRFVSVKAGQELHDAIRNRAVFLLNRNGNELSSVVELAGCARRNGLMGWRDRESAVPDELVEVCV